MGPLNVVRIKPRKTARSEAPDAELERLVETARWVLHSQTRQELHRLETRLKAFEDINWSGTKRHLHRKLALSGLPDAVATPASLYRHRLVLVMAWLETLLTE